MAVFFMRLLLLAGVLAADAVEEDSALARLGVNFAIPADGNPNELARKAAELGVTKVKIWDYNPNTIYLLRKYYTLYRRKVEIMVAIPQWISSPPDGHGARNETNIKNLLSTMRENKDIVRGVFVYNEPCVNGFCKGQAGEEYLWLLNHLADELKDEGYMVTTPFSMGGILQPVPNSDKLLDPDFMRRVLDALAKTKAPVAFNVYPYLDYAGYPNTPVNQALGSVGPGQMSQIDFDLRALRTALNSLGQKGVDTPIMIGETGWAHTFGEDPGTQDYWKERVYKVSNFDSSNAYYTNLGNKLPWYVQNWNLAAIYIFALADEPLKPLRNPACSHGQPPNLWAQFQCGAYVGEKWFGITGLWKDTSKSPWNLGESNSDESKAVAMRKKEWQRFYSEEGALQWVIKHQPKNAETAKEELKKDAELLTAYKKGHKKGSHVKNIEGKWERDEIEKAAAANSQHQFSFPAAFLGLAAVVGAVGAFAVASGRRSVDKGEPMLSTEMESAAEMEIEE